MDSPADRMPRLTIGVSALANEIESLELPPPCDDWEIVLVVQGGAPPVIERSDLRVETLDSLGVADSRNRVLAVARTEFVLFGDADSVVIPAGVNQVVDYLERHGEVGVVLCQSTDERGALRKRFSSRQSRLSRWNSARAGTIEIVVRCAYQREADVWFDTGFGAGSPVRIGDEYIFISDLLRAGVVGQSLPIPVASHPGTSSGQSGNLIEERAAVLRRVFGPRKAALARLLFVVRRPLRFGSARATFQFLSSGGVRHERSSACSARSSRTCP